MNNLIPFDYHGKEVRIVSVDGEPWFVAKDVCDILELDICQIRRLDEDEKGLHSTQTLGGIQEMSIITESGLYSLTLGSKKPEAKPFKRWVTHEVIPAIRKTGTYSAKPMSQVEMLAAQAQAMVELERKTNEAKQIATDTKTAVTTALNVLATPPEADWQEATKDRIVRICKENGLSYLKVYDALYRELEHGTNTDLKARVRNKKARLKKAGATAKELGRITELYIVAHESKLKLAFDGITRRYEAKYSALNFPKGAA